MLISGEISSLVIDSLRKQTRGENMIVLSLYCDYQCDYQTQKEQSAVNIIGSLLSQVALGARQIPSEVQGAFDSEVGISDGHDQIMIDHCNYDLIDFIDHGTARS